MGYGNTGEDGARRQQRVAGVDPLGVYLQAIAEHPLLTKAEEERLGTVMAAGRSAAAAIGGGSPQPARRRELKQRVSDGERAAVELLQANLRLVVSMAKRYRSLGLPLLDLIQEGNLGLLHAVERFDHTKGFRFSTYASWWVREAIFGAVQTGRMIRLPINAGKTALRVQKAQLALEMSTGRAPTTAALAAELGMEPGRVAEVLGYPREPVSMSMAVGAEGDLLLGDLIADPQAESPCEAAMATLLPAEVAQLLRLLDSRESEILRLRYGLGRVEPLTLEQVGQRLQLTKERVRQIEAKAMDKLRPRMASKGASDLLTG